MATPLDFHRKQYLAVARLTKTGSCCAGGRERAHWHLGANEKSGDGELKEGREKKEGGRRKGEEGRGGVLLKENNMGCRFFLAIPRG
jgi:hypothetical protein